MNTTGPVDSSCSARAGVFLTLLLRWRAGDACGVRRPSIMDITLSGTLVASPHLSCQVDRFSVRSSRAFKDTRKY